MTAKDFLEKYNISTNEVIYSSDDEAHRLVDLMNGFIEELSELKKLRVGDVSRRSEQLVCDMCGSSKLEECGSDEYSCEECGHFPITN